ncbi:oxidoreductase [Novosphingobium sp. PASSN1]|uniref:oxidoreductase n=1 Tax=Novosphingobium sp. PASSN1 TaxID=2015561 RepID=UPI000BCEB274|nr:oxidoreductase [Novosphingobium sp. PASSN1]OYU35265.1 MAG: oxidoreductase [Novosphingobium sp. PASSN1]
MHRIALIGFGLAGKAFHAPLIAATPGLKLAAVVSSRAADVAVEYPDALVVPTLEAVLADCSIDLVVLATPDHLHTEQALAALDAGKHVVIDKPLAPTLEEARRVAAYAAARGLMLSVFHNRRWDADFLTLRRLIAEGVLGEITAMESRFDRFRPEPGERWKDRRAGGVWQDLGPHLADQALVLFGRPQAVSADLAVLKLGGHAVDHAEVLLRYSDRRVSLHISQLTADHALRLAVHGTRGSFVKHGLDNQEEQSKAGVRPGDPAWGIDPSPGRLTQADGTISVVVPERGDYLAFYRGVAAALAGKGPMPVSAEEALAVMEVIAAGIASSDQRREILL